MRRKIKFSVGMIPFFQNVTRAVEKETDEMLKILCSTSFSSLTGSVSSQTIQAVEDMGFTEMTEIQAKCIPPLLEVTSHGFIYCIFGLKHARRQ